MQTAPQPHRCRISSRMFKPYSRPAVCLERIRSKLLMILKQWLRRYRAQPNKCMKLNRRLFQFSIICGLSLTGVYSVMGQTKVMNNSTNATELATLGGGCFWCTEAIYQMLPGVKSVKSGYAGGQK